MPSIFSDQFSKTDLVDSELAVELDLDVDKEGLAPLWCLRFILIGILVELCIRLVIFEYHTWLRIKSAEIEVSDLVFTIAKKLFALLQPEKAPR